MRDINAIAILHGESLEVIWIWGPTNFAWEKPREHYKYPTLIELVKTRPLGID